MPAALKLGNKTNSVFRDIQNNEGLDKCYQPRHSALADKTNLTLDPYSQYLFIISGQQITASLRSLSGLRRLINGQKM